MRYSFAASSLLGLAAAAPQVINIGAALAVPTPTVLGPKIEETKPAAITYNPTAAASAVAAVVKGEGVIEKRDDAVFDITIGTTIDAAAINQQNGTASVSKRAACDAQPVGAGPVASPDTAAAFLQDSRISNAATSAATPSGYEKSFMNKAGSSQQIGYLTYKSFNTYDVQGCADACDGERYCRGFNIYFERDPTLEPGSDCPNPASTTNIKCSLYGYPVGGDAATNQGQWRQQFQVVIAGSNGYSKLNKGPPSVDSFKPPTALPAAINAPLDNGYDTYDGMRLFNDNPYDPALCAAACQAQTDYDKAHPDSNGKYKPCNFFTSYILTKNDVPLGTYCSFYTRTWDSSYATNTGYYYGDDRYKVIDAASYEITNPNSGAIGGQSSSSVASSTITSSSSSSSSSTATPTPTFTPFPAGVNVLQNSGFESISLSGPSGTMDNWSNIGGGRVYPNRLQAAAHGGSTYAIMNYLGQYSNPVPIMTQSLTAFDTTKSYTLTFSYDLHSIISSSSCTLSVSLGDVTIYTKTLKPADGPGPYKWKGPVTSTAVTPASREAALSFKYDCSPSGSSGNANSYIFLDDLSLSSN